MEKAINAATSAAVAISAAESRIRDVDVAEETSNMSRNQVLLQAGVSVLAQANQLPQVALKLLNG
jgi:flagellin